MRHTLIAFSLSLLLAAGAYAEEDRLLSGSLAELNIEDLSNITVTSASKREEKQFEVASAIYVLTSDDIRRAGATNIPGALKMVPGMASMNVDLNNYHVTIRGHSDLIFTDRLLVLMDGRELQSPTFSAVNWPAQNYPMEDIDRIEVILGPGASLWGHNAMDGVINIITKKAQQTEGVLISAGAGNREKRFATVRYGARGEDGFSWRVYGMGTESNNSNSVVDEYSDTPGVGHTWFNQKETYQGGFRADWERQDSNTTLILNAYDVAAGSEGSYFLTYTSTSDTHAAYNDRYIGQNILLQQERQIFDNLHASLQLYYDRTDTHRIIYQEKIDTLDGELQLDYRWTASNLLQTGLTYQFSSTNFTGSTAVEMPNDILNLYGLFMQNEITMFDGVFHLTPGFRLERNKYTGWEFQPSIRAAVVENPWMVWGSVSRVVRLPNSLNNSLQFNQGVTAVNPQDGLSIVGMVVGNGGLVPEEMIAYEAGIRVKPTQTLSVDLTTFWNVDKNTIDTVTTQNPSNSYSAVPAPHYYFPQQVYDNVFEGETYGGELKVDAKPTDWIRTFASYTYTKVNLRPMGGKNTADTQQSADWINTSTPVYQAKGGIFVDLPRGFEFDVLGFYNAEAADFNYPFSFRLDLRIAYRPSNHLEIALTGRNLTREYTREYQSIGGVEENAWIPRDVYLKLTYHY